MYVSANGTDWGSSKAGISGKKGEQEVDYSSFATSASAVYVKIENTSSGDLNIHGANIRLAGGSSWLDNREGENKRAVAVKYYNLWGMEIQKPQSQGTYVQETNYEDGTIESKKVFVQ